MLYKTLDENSKLLEVSILVVKFHITSSSFDKKWLLIREKHQREDCIEM